MTFTLTMRASAALAVVVVAGCGVSGDTSSGGIRSTLGLDAGAPDEFLIIANDPLQLPPSFELNRPTPGAPSRVAPNPTGDAHSALFRTEEPVRLAAISPGEAVLLSGAGADGDNSAVRQALAEENPDSGPRDFALTSIFGIPIPATIGDLESALESRTEVENLRKQGYRTPALPPLPPETDIDDE